jgi:hypothetical protein
VPLYQLPDDMTVADSGYYDIDPKPWPTTGGMLAPHVHALSGETGDATPAA